MEEAEVVVVAGVALAEVFAEGGWAEDIAVYLGPVSIVVDGILGF
jgi:hypothetical protein